MREGQGSAAQYGGARDREQGGSSKRPPERPGWVPNALPFYTLIGCRWQVGNHSVGIYTVILLSSLCFAAKTNRAAAGEAPGADRLVSSKRLTR